MARSDQARHKIRRFHRDLPVRFGKRTEFATVAAGQRIRPLADFARSGPPAGTPADLRRTRLAFPRSCQRPPTHRLRDRRARVRACPANGVADKRAMPVDGPGGVPKPRQIVLAGPDLRIGTAKRIDRKTFVDTVLADVMQRNTKSDSPVQPSRERLLAFAALDLSAFTWVHATNPVVVADIGHLVRRGDRGQTGSFQASRCRRQKDGRMVERGKPFTLFGEAARASPLGWATIKGGEPPSCRSSALSTIPGKADRRASNLVGARPEESDRFLGGIASKPDQIRHLPAPDEEAAGWVRRIRCAAQINRGKLKRRRHRRECFDDFRMKPCRSSGRRERLFESLPVEISQNRWRKFEKPSKYGESLRSRRFKSLNTDSRRIPLRPFRLLLR